LARRLRQALERPGFSVSGSTIDLQTTSRSVGVISNKHVTIMAWLITCRQEPRSFDDTWAIVTNWLLEQHAKQPRPEDAA
jgi:hypothetical protein